ncbi:hypothetical protein J6590_023125, partial [Homalodisca vitripennis]
SSIFILFMCLAASSAFHAKMRDPTAVKLSIYYEAECHQSRDFFNKQLWPHWADLEEGVKLELVPYGKANHTEYDGQWLFQCDHGESECLANKLHACVIKKLQTHPTKMIKCIKCLMTKKDQLSSLSDCLNEIFLKAETDKYWECLLSPETDELLVKHGDRTHKMFTHLDSTPKIVFNDKFRPRESYEAQKDFTKPICQYMKEICKKK